MDKLQQQFSKLYDQYIAKIYRFAFLRVNSKDAAQDIVSETFSRAWTAMKNSTSANWRSGKVENWPAFLYRIARNLIVDLYRERGKIQIVSASAVIDPDPDLDLEGKAIFSSDMERVKKALSEIGEEQQEVIIWRYLDGLSIKEISHIIEKPEGTVRVILHRGLEALKKKL